MNDPKYGFRRDLGTVNLWEIVDLETDAKVYGPVSRDAAAATAASMSAAAADRPPLGLMPRWRWLEQRQIDLLGAMSRYAQDGRPIHDEWYEEMMDLGTELRKEQANRKAGKETP